MLGSGVHLGAGMLASFAGARLLGAAQFGELSITRTTLYTFTLIGGASLGAAASRAIAALRMTDPERAGRVLRVLLDLGLIVSAVAAAGCLALAIPLSRQLGAPHLATTVALTAPAVVFTAMSAVQVGALHGFEAFGVAGRLLAAEGILTSALLTGGMWIGGVRGGIAGIVVAAAGAWLLRHRALRKIHETHGVSLRGRHRIIAEWPLLRTLVVPSALFALVSQPFAWLARALLARGPLGLAEVGVFSVAFSWGAAVLTVSGQITRPAMPILTNLLAHGDTAAFKRTLRDTLLLAFGAALLVALPVMALSPWIVRAYGSHFATGALVLCAVAFSSVLGSISAALRSALIARGDVWGQVLQSLLWGFTLILVFQLLRRHGALALAVAYNVAFLATLVAQGVIAASALQSGRNPRAAVDLSDPALTDPEPLLEDPDA